jgi:hypothetical protein
VAHGGVKPVDSVPQLHHQDLANVLLSFSYAATNLIQYFAVVVDFQIAVVAC